MPDLTGHGIKCSVGTGHGRMILGLTGHGRNFHAMKEFYIIALFKRKRISG
jgi:hypothetical protein